MSRSQMMTAVGLSVAATLMGCQPADRADAGRGTTLADRPIAVFPIADEGPLTDPDPLPAGRAIADLTAPGAVVKQRAVPTVIDTRAFTPQIVPLAVDQADARRIKVHLPPHERPAEPADENEPLDGFELGALRGDATIDPGSVFDFTTLDSAGWNPPDPALAVGPEHVVVTVNQTVGWYVKDTGVQQFQQILGSQGSPGFFEPVGGGSFTFDPKCFYDHLAGRFVVLALEVYGNSETAYITIAVSDDADPNGTWYKYRTDAVIEVSGVTYWWDYPGLGFDDEAYYVTGNLFGLSADGFAGAGFRTFDKADMLAGNPVDFWTLRDGGSSSVQCAQHFGDNPAAYFMRGNGGNSLKIHAIQNPVSSPTLLDIDVAVPSYSGAPNADVQGGGDIFVVGSRLMTVQWRDGRLYTAHAVGSGGAAKARWYEVDVNGWPSGSFPGLVQSGTIDFGVGKDTFFPAVYSNDTGGVGLVFGSSAPDETIAMWITARNAGDPAGSMGTPVLIRQSPFGISSNDSRWGDYYDIALDPDGQTFWAIGQTQESFGWDTRVARFALVNAACNAADLAEPFGVLDLGDIGAFVDGFQNQDPAVDLAPPTGVFDLNDIQAFIEAFSAGCP